jgi:hypothetical protein
MHWPITLSSSTSRRPFGASTIGAFQRSACSFELCDNLIFRRRAALDKLGERLLDANRTIGQPNKITVIFGRKITKESRGKLQTELEDMHLPNPIIRSHYRNGFIKQYMRDHLILRTEAATNNVTDYGVNKAIEHLAALRENPQMLDTMLGVLRQQLPHVDSNAKWRRALKQGIRDWKSTYAEVQISQTLAVARVSGLRQIPWRATASVFSRIPASFLGVTCRRISRALRSRLMPRRRKSVRFGDLRRLHPVSPNFGFDPGKPVDRRYIEDFLFSNAKGIKGRVLEIGDNAYTRQYGEARVTRSDVLHIDGSNPRATLVGDLAEGDHLPSEVFDCIVMTQTLQYVFDVHKGVATLHRMLKPGGVLL